MEVKPTDLVLALMQFLEILLPGALISFLLKDFADAHVFGGCHPILPKPGEDAQGWVVFFFASYLLGHFVFLIAAFLDDTLYDPTRKKWKPVEKDLAYLRATEIKRIHLPEKDGEEVVNTFQWAKAIMNLRFPTASAEIKRHESDSKFFRSLVVVFLAIAAVQCSRAGWLSASGCLVLALLSFWRYFDQRWKSNQAAYIHLLAMTDTEEPPTSQS